MSNVWLPADQVLTVAGVRATSLARAGVDVARTGDVMAGVVVLDGVLARGTSMENLHEVLRGCRNWRGSVDAGRALRLARCGAESPLESIGRFQMLRQGIPEPELQVEVRDRHGLVGGSTTTGAGSGWSPRLTG